MFSISASGTEETVGGNTCLQTTHNQQYRMSHDGLLIQDDFCFSLADEKSGNPVISELCDPTNDKQLWTRFRPKPPKKASKTKISGYQIKHKTLNLCFDVSSIKETGLLAVKCNDKEVHQRFLFGYQAFKV